MIEQEIIFNGQALSYHVKFNRRRKTRSLIKVLPSGGVLVDAPASVNLLQIRHWVTERAEWLLQRKNEIDQKQGFIRPLSYVDGEPQLFLGQSYHLKLFSRTKRSQISGLSGDRLHLQVRSLEREHVKLRLWAWYRTQARTIFSQRLTVLAESIPWLDETPDLRLRKMRRRWGSCSSLGLVTLNTHLIKAPQAYTDFVIYHELCHLREHNHSARFYRLMDQVQPEWRTVKQALDAESDAISNE